jgi:hypothetical protein
MRYGLALLNGEVSAGWRERSIATEIRHRT